jgi:hypothetical protein
MVDSYYKLDTAKESCREADKRELGVKKARQMATSKSNLIQFFCSQTIENNHMSRSVYEYSYLLI